MKRERIADDYYSTPAWCTELVLPILEASLGRPPASVFDPSCGDGAILDVAKAHGLATSGMELHPGRAAQARANGHDVTACEALGSTWPASENAVIVGNPPYRQALDFAERAAQWARAGNRRAALLLRLGFAESRTRYAFHRSHPSSMYVLAERPRFRTDTRGSDASGYAWFVWGRTSRPGMESTWTVLDRR
jgi:hypothetical protein